MPFESLNRPFYLCGPMFYLFVLNQCEQGVSGPCTLMQDCSLFTSPAHLVSMRLTHCFNSRRIGTFWKISQHHRTLRKQTGHGLDHTSVRMTETLMQLSWAPEMANFNLLPFGWGKQDPEMLSDLSQIAQLICYHQFYLTSESTFFLLYQRRY